MIPIIPKQREFKSNASKPFNDLIAYLVVGKEQEQGARLELSNQFSDILDYATNPLDEKTKGEKCIAIRTHGVSGISTASIEMNAVARKNTRCTDPVYHIILSWPEHEQPAPEAIFDAAEHSIQALGLGEHQYVVAIHGNTDNMHCHISVNRVHPITFKSRHMEWAKKTLHLAARQSEIKHGWTHDNGIYIVQVDGHGKKQIVLNTQHADALDKAGQHAHREMETEESLPTWHDPESLDSWLKSKVARALKRDLPDLTGWHALHAWLSNYDIRLTDSGGGGMRLQAVSPETGEILDVAASKGLRLLKRSELEKRWGPFTDSLQVPCIVPDLSHLSPNQINKGAEHVIRNTLDGGRPPDHIIRAQEHSSGLQAEGGSGLHDVPYGDMDDGGQVAAMPLQGALQGRLGDEQAGENPDLRRAGAGALGGRSGRGLGRDDSKREERREQRAAARADLRQRFAQYRRFVRGGDTEYFLQVQALKAERSLALNEIRSQGKAAKSAIPKGTSNEVRLVSLVEIDAESLRRKLQVESVFQERSQSLRATRTPPLSWRIWLHEQSNLGDQAALSALRGIVYQAQRDAKLDKAQDRDEIDAEGAAYHLQQYRRVMARLIEEEQREAAIRSTNLFSMRPHEIDALLMRYAGIQWRVTGNGNVEYSDLEGSHLFTDRGNRITYDRVRVSDEDIQLALVHAQHKFGKQLTLTGDDHFFTAKMARLADDMGLTILNPDMQQVISEHRASRKLQIAEATTVTPIVEALPPSRGAPGSQELMEDLGTPQERLRVKVLAIDPHATFVTPDPANSPLPYVGPVAAVLEGSAEQGFAQHTGRGVYALHAMKVPDNHNNAVIEIQYRNGQPVTTIQTKDQGKGRGN